MKHFTGIYPALVTHFDESGRVSLGIVTKLIDSLLEKGVSGFYVGGSTGEAYLLTSEERKQYLEAVMKVVDGRCDVIANIGMFATEHAIELARHAESVGVAAVSSVPPFYFPFEIKEYITYYHDIANAVTVPVILYNIPAMSKVNFTKNDIKCIFANDNIGGMKHTSYDLFQLQKIVEEYPDKTIFCGHDELFLPAYSVGVTAAIGSTFNFMADKFVRMSSLLDEGKAKDALILQGEVNAIIEVLSKLGMFKGVKAALQMQGIDCGFCRSPFLPLKEEERTLLRCVLEENGVL